VTEGAEPDATSTDGIDESPATAATRPAVRRLIWREAEVQQIVPETARVKSLVLRVPGWPGHLPGQHVDVRLTAADGYQAERSYSIASAPEPMQTQTRTSGEGPGERQGEQIVLTVERIDDGEVSPFLTDELRVGDKLELRGPIGGYFTWGAGVGRPLQLLAGGSGIVPLMAMLRHRARVAPELPACLLYSSRTWDGIIYREELRRLSDRDPQLTVMHTLTRERPPSWTGQSGRVDGTMLRALAFPPEEEPEVFVCGPTPFVESVANQLVAWGHDAGRVKTERFGPTGGS
jgi:ferredoxin-NADP reductase